MSRSLLVLAALCAIPAAAQSPERFSVEVSGGLLSADTFIDGDRTRVDSEYRASFFELGGEAHLVRRTALTGSVGAFLRFADVSYGDGFSSGFGPQNVGLYGSVRNDALAARLGFLLDVGGSLDPTSVPSGPVRSDQQDAFLLGLGGQHSRGPARFFGGLDAFLTLPDEQSLILVDMDGDELGFADFDQGDLYAFHAGGGYGLGRAELGLRLQYTYTTDSSIDFGDVDPADLGLEFENGTIEGSDRYQLSVIPYVEVRPGPAGLSFTVQGSAMGGGLFAQEYAPVGLLLVGEATEAPRFPVTLRARYGF